MDDLFSDLFAPAAPSPVSEKEPDLFSDVVVNFPKAPAAPPKQQQQQQSAVQMKLPSFLDPSMMIDQAAPTPTPTPASASASAAAPSMSAGKMEDEEKGGPDNPFAEEDDDGNDDMTRSQSSPSSSPVNVVPPRDPLPSPPPPPPPQPTRQQTGKPRQAPLGPIHMPYQRVVAETLRPLIDAMTVEGRGRSRAWWLAKERENSGESSGGPATDAPLQELPVYTAEHESALLIEYGKRRSPYNNKIIDSPPCKLMERCIGFAGRFEGFTKETPGVILMMRMSPEELEIHYRTGASPRTSRTCILCFRALLTSAVRQIRQLVRGQLSTAICLQEYWNPCDGYHDYVKRPTDTEESREAATRHLSSSALYNPARCLVPSGTQYDGIVRPVAMFEPTCLFAVYDHMLQKWRIDQSLMLCHFQ